MIYNKTDLTEELQSIIGKLAQIEAEVRSWTSNDPGVRDALVAFRGALIEAKHQAQRVYGLCRPRDIAS